MILDSECKEALRLFNNGQWVQLEGSVGRWVQSFLDANIIVQDEKNGAVSVVDGYGRHLKYNKAHIDWDKVLKIQEEE
jgi:hypothetical protein